MGCPGNEFALMHQMGSYQTLDSSICCRCLSTVYLARNDILSKPNSALSRHRHSPTQWPA
ncbi:hypothetical protein I7I48_08090 [Histoplasma ohiense]|nr:hypothetical protein I7I48_08090 [Histoplasma ohiense (nom. inval.)]